MHESLFYNPDITGIPSTHILGALISPEAGTEFSNAQQPKINLSHREKL